jgi:hypothetical protein
MRDKHNSGRRAKQAGRAKGIHKKNSQMVGLRASPAQPL